jgi:hypothetical protein
MNVRRQQFQIAKEHVGHQRVIMLTRMNDKRRELSLAPLHRLHNGRDFHEIGTRTGDDNNFEHGGSEELGGLVLYLLSWPVQTRERLFDAAGYTIVDKEFDN